MRDRRRRLRRRQRRLARDGLHPWHRPGRRLSYLADQLILPFVLAGGGSFTTVKPSQHLTTAIEVIGRFIGRRVTLGQDPNGTHRVTIS